LLSLAFRIFAEYSKTSKSHSAVEAVLAQENRLLKDGEEPELERGPAWDQHHKSPARHGAAPKC
jgi:hypothetical protein